MKSKNSLLVSAVVALLFVTIAFCQLDSSSLPEIVKAQLPGFRIARASDYAKALTGKDIGQTVHQADFNQDGTDDWAVIVINDREKEYRVYYVLTQKSGHKLDLLFSRRWKGNSLGDGPIRTPMFLKLAGEPGISDRTYNSLTQDGDLPDTIVETKRIAAHNKKAQPYKSVPAIELWTGISGDEKDTDIEGIAYRSETWYYEAGTLKTFDAYD